MASNAGTNAAQNDPEVEDPEDGDVSRETSDNEDTGLTPPPPGSDPAPSAAAKLPGARA